MHDPLVLAYLAGIIDGEGCIGYQSNGGGRRTFTIEVKMTNQLVIDLLHSTFGGAYQSRPSTNVAWKDQHRWRVKGEKAEEVYRALKPYLRIK